MLPSSNLTQERHLCSRNAGSEVADAGGLACWSGSSSLGFLGWDTGKTEPEPTAGEGRLAKRLHVTVHQGRLSVDLYEAEVAKVLARIGHEAGVIITGSPISGARVSAQFTDMEFAAGLRRLLQRASLNYAVRYARDSTGAVAMHEVRVFGMPSEGPPLR